MNILFLYFLKYAGKRIPSYKWTEKLFASRINAKLIFIYVL